LALPCAVGLLLASACGDDLPSAPTSSSTTGAVTSGASVTVDDTSPATTRTSAAATTSADDTGTTTAGFPVPGLSFQPIVVDDPIKRATALAFVPDSSEFLMASKDGEVAHYALRGDAAQRLGGFTLDTYSYSDCGVISLAFDPDFAENRLLYVGLCTSRYQSGVFRVEIGADFDYDAVAATIAPVIEVGHPRASNPWHNVGSIGFDPAGNLWAVFGDKTVPGSSQDLASNLGAIVRIVPDRSPGGSGYTPAAGNPFADDPTRSPDIWAYGFRSPWKALLDAQGRFFVADVGSDHFEEINLVATAGRNLGWPRHEGLCDTDDCRDFVDPITTWPHGSHPYINDDPDVEPVNARVGWVGAIYEDRGNDPYEGALTGRVLFGDSCLGYVRALEVDDEGQVVFDEHLGHLVGPTSWAQAPDGYLYVVSYNECGSGSNDPTEHPRVTLLRAVLAAP
jgi:glucose/arabinose dehydrogenase